MFGNRGNEGGNGAGGNGSGVSGAGATSVAGDGLGIDDEDAGESQEDLDASAMLAQFFQDPAAGSAAPANQGAGDAGSGGGAAQKPAGTGTGTGTGANAADPDVAAVQAMVQESLASLRLPDDFAFEALSSSDPREQRQAYQSLQQHTVIATIQAIMPVMQHAFQQFDTSVNQRIETSSQSLSRAGDLERIMTREIPAYSNDQFKGMVKHLDTQLRNSGVDDPVGRARRINQMLIKLGVNGAGKGGQGGQGNQGSRGGQGNQGGMLSGSAALDSLFSVTVPRKSR